MSRPERQLVLAPQAEDDLADILQYTLQSYRFFPAGEHLIAYRISETHVEVSRILHGRMDLKAHF